MDRSLDEIIGEKPSRPRGSRPGPRPEPRHEPRRPPPPRAPRREEYPRDGVRKFRRDDRINLDSDWVHDRFEEDRFDRGRPADGYEARLQAPPPRAEEGAKIRIDNVHYDLSENDLQDLFERIGPIVNVRMLYDKADRSMGTAFVTYRDIRDAEDAVKEFNGCTANGLPIKLTLMPQAPAASARGLFDRVERPSRSLFDRIDAPDSRDDSREDARPRRRRSESPRRRGPPENIDRYVPRGARSRSPIKRRGTPRDTGRRPGQRRTESGRGGRRGGRTDGEGHALVGGRPRKTAEELDAEMADYWGKPGEEQKGGTISEKQNGLAPAASAADDDIDMIE